MSILFFQTRKRKQNLREPKGKWSGPVKVQRPISGDMSVGLIYNQDKSICCQVPTEEIIDLFPEGVFKVYCMADWLNGKLTIGNVVPNQRW